MQELKTGEEKTPLQKKFLEIAEKNEQRAESCLNFYKMHKSAAKFYRSLAKYPSKEEITKRGY